MARPGSLSSHGPYGGAGETAASARQLARIGRRRDRDVVQARVLRSFQPAAQVPQAVELGLDLAQARALLLVDLLVHVDRLALGLERADGRDDLVELHLILTRRALGRVEHTLARAPPHPLPTEANPSYILLVVAFPSVVYLRALRPPL